MILVVRKSNISLIVLIFLLSIAIYSLNMGVDSSSAVSATQKTIIVDAGHGGEDPGAVSDYSGTCEKDINLIIAKLVKENLETSGYNVIMTREEDVLVYSEGTTNIVQKRKQDLLRRKGMMDNSGADIVVSIHLNKFPQTQYYGAQTFYPPDSEDSRKLANFIQKSVRENVDENNTRQSLLKKDKIIILKELKTPTTIVECGFLSNSEEEKKLVQEEYQKKLAKAIKEGIDNYFGF